MTRTDLHPASAGSILLWGGGSQARIVTAMLLEFGLEPAMIFDEARDQPSFSTKANFSNRADDLVERLPQLTHFIVCIGGDHGYARDRSAQSLVERGLAPINLVHARGFIDPTATIAEGLLAMPGATVHKFVKIGRQAVLNTNCTVDHECILGHGVHVMGSAAVAGRVTIGDFATIGTNATILPDITIGEGASIGAGAVVTRHVPSFATMAGVPARQIGKHRLQMTGVAVDRLSAAEQ